MQDDLQYQTIRTPKAAAAVAIKGFFMGVAEIIPGVSGGTIALVLGIYPRFIDSVRSYTPSSVLHFLRSLPKKEARGEAARAIHLDFVVPLLVGMGIALLALAKPMKSLLADHPNQMNAIFFGMIVVSLYVPVARMKKRSLLHLVVGIAGLVVAYIALGVPIAAAEKANLPFLFFAGGIAICAMVLPGVSGSYLLKALGQYEHILTAIHERDLVTVAVVGAGIIIGLATFARVVSWLLHHHHDLTLAALTGLMLGSLRTVWPFKDAMGQSVAPHADFVLWGLVLAGALVVGALIFADHKYGGTD